MSAPTTSPVRTTRARRGITVLVMAGAAALLGWAFLAVLERFTAQARRIWLVTALVVLVLSFVMPFNSGEIDGSAQLALLAMHLAVGAVLIPLLVRTSGD
jgi:cytochrome bd-type quinol oxidase subunit 2